MIVSRNWLRQYVSLDMPLEELTHRLTMAGLNLESTAPVGDDVAIDLEVTSNRPDCLGHLGVAREIGVLFERELQRPPADPPAVAQKTAAVTSVVNEREDLCPQYMARVIRGVKVGPSPDWLQTRLQAVGVASINNIVDITNYVLLECSQPLHAFDFDKLQGRRIVVRRGRNGEEITAIDQRRYALAPEMCVIADAERPVAVAGVMGGFDTEIGEDTVNVLIETAEFAPLSVRNTARKLNLHSPSSYRFERGVDPHQLDWASRRCCQLILELAGGELLDEAVTAGAAVTRPVAPIVLRFPQIRRILGIEVPPAEAVQILSRLGLEQVGDVSENRASFLPPTWRRDITREADLLEEVARIHGYDQIPEDVAVPLQLSAKTHRDRVIGRVQDVLIAAGFFEAITFSFVSEMLFELFRPRTGAAPLRVEHSSRRQENILRQSLVPSLLQSRRENERHGTFGAQLFEIAKVYLAGDPGRPETQPPTIGLVSGRSFAEFKGVVEALADSINHAARVTLRPSDLPQFVPGRGAEVLLDGRMWGWLGELDRSVTDRLDLRDAVTAAELDLSVLEESADLTPRYTEIAPFPAVARDLNFVLEESVTWQQLEETVRAAAGPLLETVAFGDQYRGPQIPAGKKSYVLTIHYRSPSRTLTAEEVESAQQAVVTACERELGAVLR